MKKAWKGILGLLMAMTFTVSVGRMVYAETVDENHEVPDGVTVNGMELGGLTVKAAEDKLQQYMDEVCRRFRDINCFRGRCHFCLQGF